MKLSTDTVPNRVVDSVAKALHNNTHLVLNATSEMLIDSIVEKFPDLRGQLHDINHDVVEKITRLTNALKLYSTNYRRTRILKESGLYVEPVPRHVVSFLKSTNVEGEIVKKKYNYFYYHMDLKRSVEILLRRIPQESIIQPPLEQPPVICEHFFKTRVDIRLFFSQPCAWSPSHSYS